MSSHFKNVTRDLWFKIIAMATSQREGANVRGTRATFIRDNPRFVNEPIQRLIPGEDGGPDVASCLQWIIPDSSPRTCHQWWADLFFLVLCSVYVKKALAPSYHLNQHLFLCAVHKCVLDEIEALRRCVLKLVTLPPTLVMSSLENHISIWNWHLFQNLISVVYTPKWMPCQSFNFTYWALQCNSNKTLIFYSKYIGNIVMLKRCSYRLKSHTIVFAIIIHSLYSLKWNPLR